MKISQHFQVQRRALCGQDLALILENRTAKAVEKDSLSKTYGVYDTSCTLASIYHQDSSHHPHSMMGKAPPRETIHSSTPKANNNDTMGMYQHFFFFVLCFHSNKNLFQIIVHVENPISWASPRGDQRWSVTILYKCPVQGGNMECLDVLCTCELLKIINLDTKRDL